ncbi:hypothetical protein M8C13_35475 [Crossiella sp. SN42]|uniref:hypothetical protein n=1 Tax=Crossiella sp. SN42 TaxID=2944808 RepID=UPI00207D67A6|nr:hypothetical protein [Crossiella sp. SN42]MCO1581066.1 hypothetical protein [Crossiella sp. SN42]
MRAVRVVGLVATAVALTVGMTASPASAGSRGEIEVTNQVGPGDKAELRGNCAEAESGASASSPAFVAPVKMYVTRPSAYSVHGSALVRKDAVPGTYDLVLTCGKDRISGKVRVQGDMKPALLVTPASGRPGTTVKLLSVCPPAHKPSQPLSGALAGQLAWKSIGPGRYEVTAKVADVVPGKYSVAYSCVPGVKLGKVFTVLAKGTPTPPPGPGQVKDKPKGGAETGGGMS